MDFLERDRAVLRRTPRRRTPRSKLTPEQVIEIRRRIDSLSVPWSIRQLAEEYDVGVLEMTRIARRQHWDEPAYEPDNREWWFRERERKRYLEPHERK